jgi:hypothetical protein
MRGSNTKTTPPSNCRREKRGGHRHASPLLLPRTASPSQPLTVHGLLTKKSKKLKTSQKHPRYAGNPTILAWDIFNEPEWCVADTKEATTAQKLPAAALQAFIGRAASIIHAAGGGALATVGSASVKWSWEAPATRPSWCMDLWGDAALVASNNGDPAAFLDFGQTHYYPWMRDAIDPFANPASTYCPDPTRKPLIIGEAQANLLKQYSAAALARNAHAQGYAGLLYWSYAAVDEKGGWDDFARCVGCANGPPPPDPAAGGASIPHAVRPPAEKVEEKPKRRFFFGF